LDVVWYLRFLRSRGVLIAASTVIGLALGLVSWWIRDSSAHYRATHTLTFQQPSNRTTWAYQSIDGVALLATGGEVVERVGEARGLSADEVAGRIITRTDDSAGAVQITVIGRQREETQQLADEVSASLKTVVAQREQERFAAERDRTVSRLQRLADELTDLDARIAVASGAELDVLTAQRRGTFNQYSFAYEQFQQFTEQGTPAERLTTFDAAIAIPIGAGDYDASVDAIETGENHLRVDTDLSSELPSGTAGFGDSAFWRAAFGAFAGLMIGLGLALCADRLASRVRTRREVEEVLGAPVLAEIPRMSAREQRSAVVVSHAQPRSRTAEAFRAARARVLRPAGMHGDRSNGESDPRSLVVIVTSSGPEEGTTTTVANLACVIAETGASVLAVNCNLHRPRLDALLRPITTAASIAATSMDGVSFADPVSDPSLPPAVAVARQRAVVDEARRTFDVVLLDTPPFLTTSDATELLPAADVVVLAARTGVTRLPDAEQAAQLLRQLGASVAGVVLVDTYLGADDRYAELDGSPPTVQRPNDADATRLSDPSEDVGAARVSR
jgi:Mrp family chromosome partitioning ATPase